MKGKSLHWITGLALAVAGANAQSLPQGPRAFRSPSLLSEPGVAPEAAPPLAQWLPASMGTNSGLRREVFLSIPGGTLADLTNHMRFPAQPDAVDTLASFETPSNAADDYGLRVSGVVVPPTSGSYRFYLCANGQAALYLGLDEHPEHKRLIAFEPIGNAPRQWTNGVAQTSRGNPATNVSGAIQLVAGQAYYVEALMKAGAGDDNFGVAWQPPSAVAPTNGAPPIGLPSLTLIPPPTSLPTSGEGVPELAGLDYAMLNFLRLRAVTAGTLAVMKDGRLVFERGYGWRDRQNSQPLAYDARMRVASISKVVTAAAIKQRGERGELQTNTAAFPSLGVQAYNGLLGDVRLNDITVDHLLYHRGGWDRALAGDPFEQLEATFMALGLDVPGSTEDVIRYQLSRPLQFSPGARFAYSNLGYLVLGRMLEQLSGKSWYDAVRTTVLRPWGVKRMQFVRTAEKLRPEDEPVYPFATTGPDLTDFPSSMLVPYPDGGNNYVEPFAGADGLVSSAADLVQLAQGYLSGNEFDLANDRTIGSTRVFRRGIFAEFSGGLYATTAVLQQGTNGVDWAYVLNKRFNDLDLDNAILSAVNSTIVWPGDNSTRVELASDAFSVDENEGNLTIGVRRTGESTGVVSVAYSTVAGSAMPGAEFTPVSGTLTFGSNEIARLITIPILDDTIAEPRKIFTIVLSDPTGGAALGIVSATVTVEDDDNRQSPSVSITSPASGALFPRGTNVALTAAPADTDGTIYAVKFFAGPTLIGEENKPPYTFVWFAPAGHLLHHRAGHRQPGLDGHVRARGGDGRAGADAGCVRNHPR